MAFDQNGNPTTNPDAVLHYQVPEGEEEKNGKEEEKSLGMAGAIRTFDRSYKSSHLALMVEFLAGALSGSAMEDKMESKNWGNFILCLSPSLLWSSEEEVRSFGERVQQMANRVKQSKKRKREDGGGDMDIFLPGERGNNLSKRRRESGNIELSEQLITGLREVAK